MKRLLIAAAFTALAGAAVAQPAYDPSQGSPPSDYPRCTHKGQDRCMSGGHRMAGHHHHGDKGDKGGKGGKSSSDGERG
jgi:hypothetical protein